MEIGQVVELTIFDLAFGGDGVGRTAEGQVIFVPFAAVGDELQVQIVSVQSHFARAEIQEIVKPGPGRVEPVCPHFGRCGGCRYQHLDYDTQVATKVAQLKAVLQRIGGFDELPEANPVVRSPQPLGYRNKLRVEPVGPVVDTGKTKLLEYGFCELDNKTFFVLDSCPLAAAPLNELLPKAQHTAWAHKNVGLEQPRPLTLRLAADNSTHFYFGYAPKKIPWLHETLCQREVSVPLDSFWQVNPGVAEAMVDTVVSWFAEYPTPMVIDAYAGVGSFSLALGEKAKSRKLIESDEQAWQAAEFNHLQWGLDQDCELLCGRTERVLPVTLSKLRRRASEATVIVDPPRAGCADKVVQALLRSSVRQVVYVSCNVATLARDLKKLCGPNGFGLSKLAFFDMFPQTAHFESVVLLQR